METEQVNYTHWNGELIWLDNQEKALQQANSSFSQVLEQIDYETQNGGTRHPMAVFPLMEDEIRNGHPAILSDTSKGRRGHLLSKDVKAILEGKSEHEAIFVFPQDWFEKQLSVLTDPRDSGNLLDAMRFHRLEFLDEAPDSPVGRIQLQAIDERGFVVKEKRAIRLRDEVKDIIDHAFEVRARMSADEIDALENRQIPAYAEKTQAIFVEEALRGFLEEVGIREKKVNIADVAMSSPEFRARSRALI
ncbi:hypothetical protein [Thioalkalivibrio sp. ALE16]|uniref:hypothetical protein n=1 Tax=Thioalkalivibrio sp. ALE16 TaxID=1158172 RepID=UPI000371BC55|nr:hypothetical protein [Thioalkalivibrio sp. ALE16]